MAYTNIDDPSAYFQTALYTGNAGNQTITNDGNSDLQPDVVWIKSRTFTSVHLLQDSTRGDNGTVYYYLQPDSNAAEAVQTDGDGITSLNSDGFSLGFGNSNSWNQSGNTYVGWQWKANGGTTSSNTDGGVTSTVQVNQDAGFSIVTWTGDGGNETIGHGLGTTPQVIITKDRDSANNWNTYHHKTNDSAPYNYPVQLNLTVSASLATGSFGTSSSDINSNTFYLKYWYNYSGDMIAYCFAEKQGYSKFGKYVGNGSTNGSFIYTGFKPAWVMVKQSNTARNWQIFDNKRDGYNIDYMPRLKADTADAEVANSGASMDFVSNGFKLRTDQTGANQSGGTYIYMAFAENPFTTSTGIPTTAR